MENNIGDCKKCWKHPSLLGTPLPKCNGKEREKCCIKKCKKEKYENGFTSCLCDKNTKKFI